MQGLPGATDMLTAAGGGGIVYYCSCRTLGSESCKLCVDTTVAVVHWVVSNASSVWDTCGFQ